MSLEGISQKDALVVIRNAGDKLLFRVMRRKDRSLSPSPHSKIIILPTPWILTVYSLL